MNNQQLPLIDIPEYWKDHWKGMPGYNHQDLEPWQSVIVHFRSREDRRRFSERVGQRLTESTQSVWYPEARIRSYSTQAYISAYPLQPRYPVYVISKGRWESRRTSKALESIKVPYKIVIEPQEYDQYAAVIDPSRILVLPFSNLGQGSIPARNWVWNHAVESGAQRHWIIDDNISGFFRFEDNLKCPVGDGTIFRIAEQFVDRYENVGLAGFQYFMFVTRKAGNIPPFYLNTRIYSCILVNHALDFRWRGRYNEDTDLSLRALKQGWCTVLFNAFLCDKEQTMLMKGGNTDELYQGNGRLHMAESLRDQHPDVVSITEKWGRYQHQVNYKPFARNRLRFREGVKIVDCLNDFGMYLVDRTPKPLPQVAMRDADEEAERFLEEQARHE